MKKQFSTEIVKTPNSFAERSLWFFLTLISVFGGLAVLTISYLRTLYPYQLEECETVVWELVDRVVIGEPIYVKPSVEFIATLYPPVYMYFGAVMIDIFGASYFPLRLLSVLAMCGSSFLIVRDVWLRTRRWAFGIIAAGLFLVSFQRSGFFMGLARVDSLWVFFLLLSFYLLRHIGSRTGFSLFFVAYLLALFTKQTTLFFLPGFVVALFRHELSGRWTRIALFVGVQASCLSAVQVATGGWFYFYCFSIPGGHPLFMERFDEFLGNAACPTVLVMILTLPLTLNYYKLNVLRRVLNPLPLLAISALLAAIVGNLKIGGSWNHFIPLFAFNGICSGVLISRWSEHLSEYRNSSKLVAWLRIVPAALILGQFGCFWHDPRGALASQGNFESQRQIEELIGAAPRPILCFAPYYFMLLNNGESPTHCNPTALQDIRLAGIESVWRPLQKDLDNLIDEGRFRTLVLFDDQYQSMSANLRLQYHSMTNIVVHGSQTPSVYFLSKR